MDERVIRERRYWDEAYRAEGLNHEKYLWSRSISAVSYSEDVFGDLLRGLRGKKVLTIGGGVDTVGVALAKNDNLVVSVDISHQAALQTSRLARQSGVEKSLNAVVMNCEEMAFGAEFDAVVCKRALHHMNLARVIEQVRRSLADGGRFIAEEPVCLLKPLRWIHEKLPFHPDAPRTADEVEFAFEDLALIAGTFRAAQIHYIDFLTRESVKHFFWKARAGRLLRPLGRLDYALLNRRPTPLKYLSTYAIIQAFK